MQTERLFRLRGKGVKNVRSKHVGDLYCRLSIETPVKLTDKQKVLLREFDTLMRRGGSRHNPREESWLSKIRTFLSK
ncbi:MAG: molecular chaperone DnaJ, partial [Acidiferrobacterales bacterium]